MRVRCRVGVNRLLLGGDEVGWGGNSGFQALNLAVNFGARRIILIGYDMQIANGVHWHGRHGSGLNNPAESNVRAWRRHFGSIAGHLADLGVEVVNASRETALTCFPRARIEDALALFDGGGERSCV